MDKLARPPANGFVAVARRIYSPIGFSKGYNFTLFFIFCGAMLGFTLARFQVINPEVFCNTSGGDSQALPGECYHYSSGYKRVGIILHLACILPAGLLVCFQFVPFIRHKAMIFHRLNGYIVIILSLFGTVGALMIARHTFGGGVDIQAAVGFLSIIFVVSLIMAYINIKRLQIEQHRAWMLRAWFYAGSIITTRIINVSAASIITRIGGYTQLRTCAQILDVLDKHPEEILSLYPACNAYGNGTDPDALAIVRAHWNGNEMELAVAFGISFGMSLFIAIALHMIGIEIYLRLTPAEFERLRLISYQRQREAGMENPGSAGLTVDRFGDAKKWVPEDGEGDENALVL